jgi:drug/metabolite transporter (DMT)-like permease
MATHETKMKIAPWALLAVSASWGLAFVIMKDPIEKQNVNSFLATRFVLAVLVMIAIRPRVLSQITREMLIKGFFAGLFLGSGYIFQTFGLKLVGAAITGFVTGLYVVATPLIAWLVLRHRITLYTWLCVALATIGLAFLSLKGWAVGAGELLVLVSAIAFAAHIVALGQWSKGLDAYAMTVVQLATCALLTGAISIGQGYKAPVNLSGWAVVVYTAIFSTAVAFVIQTWSQAHISPTKVAVILTMEVVFAALFAMVFTDETLNLQQMLGGVLILISMLAIVIKEDPGASNAENGTADNEKKAN